jgi:hypothetical protein
MYFQITLFNIVTLFLMAATLLIAVKRFSWRLDSNWPLTYYGPLLAYWRGNAYTLDNYWVLTGVLCGLLLRFEFLGGAIEKLIRLSELLVFLYVAVRCVKLILQL